MSPSSTKFSCLHILEIRRRDAIGTYIIPYGDKRRYDSEKQLVKRRYFHDARALKEWLE